jgi:hypothetical protein
LQEHSIKPFLQIVQKNFFVSLSYQYKNKRNLKNIEYVWLHQEELNANYKMKKNGLIVAVFQFVHIQSNILENNTIGYIMMEGLHIGNNMLWELKWQMNITEYLQMDLAYNGRVSQNHKPVHLGNFQLKIVF